MWLISFRPSTIVQPPSMKNILTYGLSDMDMDKPISTLTEPWTK